MTEQPKLYKLLELILYLSSGIRRTLEEISERFEISERTALRYLKTLRQAGFIISRPRNGYYQIEKNSPYFRELDELLHFSKEEAFILQKAIHSISNENLLKQNLIRKLYALYDFERVADTIVKQEHSENIHQLIRAIQQKQQVVLKDYQSANSNEARDRLVEPFGFTTNYVAIWAYDVDDGQCKTFKNTRIGSVLITGEPWKHEKYHAAMPLDVFRIDDPGQVMVKLNLTIRACELLKEEYPLAETCIMPGENGSFVFEGPVSGLEGVGRFIMGLAGEIEIIYPEDLKIFIKKKAEKILTDIS